MKQGEGRAKKDCMMSCEEDDGGLDRRGRGSQDRTALVRRGQCRSSIRAGGQAFLEKVGGLTQLSSLG